MPSASKQSSKQSSKRKSSSKPQPSRSRKSSVFTPAPLFEDSFNKDIKSILDEGRYCREKSTEPDREDPSKPSWNFCIDPKIREKWKALGEGQAGTVYGDDNYAFKSLKLDPDAGPEEYMKNVEAFLQEAQISMDVSEKGAGPKVVDIFVSLVNVEYEAEGDYFVKYPIPEYGVIIMERLDKSFKDALIENNIINKEEMTQFEQLAEKAFQGLVDAGYSCTDIRPENIMVKLSKNRANQRAQIVDVKLIDFGGNYCSTKKSFSEKEKEIIVLAMKILLRWNTWMIVVSRDKYKKKIQLNTDSIEVFQDIDTKTPEYKDALKWIHDNNKAITAMAWYTLFTAKTDNKGSVHPSDVEEAIKSMDENTREQYLAQTKKLIRENIRKARKTGSEISRDNWNSLVGTKIAQSLKMKEKRTKRNQKIKTGAIMLGTAIGAAFLAHKLGGNIQK